MAHKSHSGGRASVLVLLILLLPSSLGAQAKSHGYVSLGAGATDLNGGLDWVIADGPIGIGGEVGEGWVFLAAITGSYHFLARRPRKHDLFATVGYAGLGSSEFSSQGVTVGGGAQCTGRWRAWVSGSMPLGSYPLPLRTAFPSKNALHLGTGVCGRALPFAFAEPARLQFSYFGRVARIAGPFDPTSNCGLQPAATDAQ